MGALGCLAHRDTHAWGAGRRRAAEAQCGSALNNAAGVGGQGDSLATNAVVALRVKCGAGGGLQPDGTSHGGFWVGA